MYTCMLLQVTTSYKSCSTFLADNWFSFSMFLRMTLELIVPWNSYLALLAVKWLFTIMWLHMYRQVTPLDTSCPTLSWVCVAIRGFQWLPAPHCLQLTIFFSPVCILLCCFRLPLLTNPAPHSLQINCFPPVCVCIQHLSWLQSHTAAQVDRQSLGRSALPYTPYTLPV